MLKQKGAEKLKPCFYGPYRVIRRVGEVAYELELPTGNRIHNIFHVSCLKKALGQQVTATEELPPTDDEGAFGVTTRSHFRHPGETATEQDNQGVFGEIEESSR